MPVAVRRLPIMKRWMSGISMTDADELKEKDMDALRRAMEMAARDRNRARQLRSMLEDQSWQEVAEFAATVAQTRALDLMPWETAPVDAETLCWENGQQVVKRDRKAG